MEADARFRISAKIGDVHFRNEESLSQIKYAKMLGVPYEKAPQEPRVYGRLADSLRNLGRFVVKLVEDM